MQVAVPADNATLLHDDRAVAPSLKVTVPVAALGDTVAVKITDCPTVEGLTEDTTEVDVSVLGVPP